MDFVLSVLLLRLPPPRLCMFAAHGKGRHLGNDARHRDLLYSRRVHVRCARGRVHHCGRRSISKYQSSQSIDWLRFTRIPQADLIPCFLHGKPAIRQ